jgi:hypothetical protein
MSDSGAGGDDMLDVIHGLLGLIPGHILRVARRPCLL